MKNCDDVQTQLTNSFLSKLAMPKAKPYNMLKGLPIATE